LTTHKLPELKHLLSTSVAARELRGSRILIYSECLREEWPEVLSEVAEGRVALSVCLEREHISHLTAKISTIIVMSKPSEVAVLTVDGSPHCLQAHFALQQALRITKARLPVKHYVVEKGIIYEVGPELVRIARHLSEIKQLSMRRGY